MVSRARSPFRRKAFALALAAVASFALIACQGKPFEGFSASTRPELVWPPAPAQARVAWSKSIHSHEDLFTEGGGFRSLAVLFGGQSDSAMARPFAVALHPSGGLLVADPGRARVHFYKWSQRRYYALGAERKGGLPSPVGVAALADGRILVSDSRLDAVLVYGPDGKPEGTFAEGTTLGRPAGIAVDEARGEVYIADVTNHQIAVFDRQGKLLRKLGKRGDGEGEFNFPTHLALTPEGDLAVADSMNWRVEIVKPDGTFVRSIGALGDAPGKFSTPKGVALDAGGRLIAVEGLHDALQFFSPKDELLLSIGQSGSRAGEFWLPAGLCIDRAQGLLFVADSYNSRVQVFRMLGENAP